MNLNAITDFLGELFYQGFELLEFLNFGWYGMGAINLFWIIVGFMFFLYWTKKLGQFQKEEAAN